MADNWQIRNKNKGERRKMHSKKTEETGHDTTLSKALSYLLRHAAPKENVKIHPGGYINIDDILKLPKFSRWTIENVHSVTENNDKQRFTIRTDPVSGAFQICANQGHSFQVEEPELNLINNLKECPVAIHGTYKRYWDSIKKSGLKRMNRTHIHFAPGEPGDDGVISGMRISAEIYIYVDMEKALRDGLKFYKSRNNVILSPGNADGIFESKYFAKVLNVRTKELIE